MALELITVTADNASFSVRENFRRIYRELSFKMPISGTARLQGNLDFDNTYTVFNVTPNGDTSAYSEEVNGEST